MEMALYRMIFTCCEQAKALYKQGFSSLSFVQIYFYFDVFFIFCIGENL